MCKLTHCSSDSTIASQSNNHVTQHSNQIAGHNVSNDSGLFFRWKIHFPGKYSHNENVFIENTQINNHYLIQIVSLFRLSSSSISSGLLIFSFLLSFYHLVTFSGKWCINYFIYMFCQTLPTFGWTFFAGKKEQNTKKWTFRINSNEI